jgi:hypothetical protein
MKLIDIDIGDWVLCLSYDWFPPDTRTREYLELFRYRGAGWDSERNFFEFHKICKVMPKTYQYTRYRAKPSEYMKWEDRDASSSRRGYRENIIFASKDIDTLMEKAENLLNVGRNADDAIEEERERVMREFIEGVRREAVVKIHNLFPEVFKD